MMFTPFDAAPWRDAMLTLRRALRSPRCCHDDAVTMLSMLMPRYYDTMRSLCLCCRYMPASSAMAAAITLLLHVSRCMLPSDYAAVIFDTL